MLALLSCIQATRRFVACTASRMSGQRDRRSSVVASGTFAAGDVEAGFWAGGRDGARSDPGAAAPPVSLRPESLCLASGRAELDRGLSALGFVEVRGGSP